MAYRGIQIWALNEAQLLAGETARLSAIDCRRRGLAFTGINARRQPSPGFSISETWLAGLSAWRPGHESTAEYGPVGE